LPTPKSLPSFATLAALVPPWPPADIGHIGLETPAPPAIGPGSPPLQLSSLPGLPSGPVAAAPRCDAPSAPGMPAPASNRLRSISTSPDCAMTAIDEPPGSTASTASTRRSTSRVLPVPPSRRTGTLPAAAVITVGLAACHDQSSAQSKPP
jgi:hypothetical protein